MQVIMIGLDIAKSVFQIHGEDASGKVVLVRRLGREATEAFFKKQPPAIVGIEACGSAHHWGRLLESMGHTVQLIPAAYVRPFVKRNKTDARDAEAICAAMRRPSMRFVPVKTVAQQAARGLETVRDLLVRQRTQLTNMVRGMLAEFGIVAARTLTGFAALRARIEANDAAIPEPLRVVFESVIEHWESLDKRVKSLEETIVARVKADATMRRLTTVPGIGPLSAHAIVAAIGDGRRFGSARDFAAWVGLTPRQHESGNKRHSGKISRQGDVGLRRLLTLGASAVMRQARVKPERASNWVSGILARRPVKVAVVAQAAKTARIAWAILRSGENFRTAGTPA